MREISHFSQEHLHVKVWKTLFLVHDESDSGTIFMHALLAKEILNYGHGFSVYHPINAEYIFLYIIEFLLWSSAINTKTMSFLQSDRASLKFVGSCTGLYR